MDCRRWQRLLSHNTLVEAAVDPNDPNERFLNLLHKDTMGGHMGSPGWMAYDQSLHDWHEQYLLSTTFFVCYKHHFAICMKANLRRSTLLETRLVNNRQLFVAQCWSRGPLTKTTPRLSRSHSTLLDVTGWKDGPTNNMRMIFQIDETRWRFACL